jgi:hypothetical protein
MSSDTQLQTIEILKQDLTQRDLEIRALRLAMEKMKLELICHPRHNPSLPVTGSGLECRPNSSAHPVRN